jgi:hypothetical protein
MLFNSVAEPAKQFRNVPKGPAIGLTNWLASGLTTGLAIGIAGGLAEVAVVALYCAGSEVSAADVARHIASAVELDGSSAWTGLLVHMTLAAILGVAIAFVRSAAGEHSARAMPLYASMLIALAAVWVINFFIVLPVLSPDFVTLLPLPLTLVSKLCFGGIAAFTLRRLDRARYHDGLPRRQQTLSQPAVAAS